VRVVKLNVAKEFSRGPPVKVVVDPQMRYHHSLTAMKLQHLPWAGAVLSTFTVHRCLADI
jgi:hypothetical protein